MKYKKRMKWNSLLDYFDLKVDPYIICFACNNKLLYIYNKKKTNTDSASVFVYLINLILRH